MHKITNLWKFGLNWSLKLRENNERKKHPRRTSFVLLNALKEHYRIGKKSWRSQIYIKLTRSNNGDGKKHPLKYLCLKCHIWWEINNLTSRLEFIAQWAFYSFLFWHRCNAKFVVSFSLFSRDPDGRLISNFYRFVSSCIWWITLRSYMASNCFVSKN